MGNRLNQSQRNRIFKRHGLTCYICGINLTVGENATIDHVIPYRIRKMNEDDNLRPCCDGCNAKKGSKTLEVFVRNVLVDAIIAEFTERSEHILTELA